jgi:thiosulfate dehydrogenase [quinone] large subunit
MKENIEMSTVNSANTSKPIMTIEDSPVTRFLFGDVRLSWIWLIVRLYTGYEWLTAGWAKVTNPAWVGAQSGAGLTSFVNSALKQTTGAHPNVQVWYAWFLQTIVLPAAPVWSWIVAFGELLVGVALILGIFTGIAAFFGGFMNVNYLLAGSLSTNPFLFVFATWLVLAWKTAGWIGLDHWILPALGTPWRPGKVFRVRGKETSPS